MVSKMRHLLSDESTRTATMLSSWCDFPSTVPQEEIISIFHDKSKRPKGKVKKWLMLKVMPVLFRLIWISSLRALTM